jgi:hypothetical protein
MLAAFDNTGASARLWFQNNGANLDMDDLNMDQFQYRVGAIRESPLKVTN